MSRGEAVLGGMPRHVWGTIATAAAVAALAFAAAPASATTDRVDYSDQANPICASTNKQTLQLYEATEAEIERLQGLHPRNPKKRSRIRERAEQLYDQLPFQFLAIYRAELEQLKAIAPPPGYEDTVASWLGTRGQIAGLYQQYLDIDRELENPIGFVGRKPSRKAIRRAQKRRENLGRLQDQIEGQLSTAFEVDLELGAKMGAAYCVTGADGDINPVISSGD